MIRKIEIEDKNLNSVDFIDGSENWYCISASGIDLTDVEDMVKEHNDSFSSTDIAGYINSKKRQYAPNEGLHTAFLCLVGGKSMYIAIMIRCVAKV